MHLATLKQRDGKYIDPTTIATFRREPGEDRVERPVAVSAR